MPTMGAVSVLLCTLGIQSVKGARLETLKNRMDNTNDGCAEKDGDQFERRLREFSALEMGAQTESQRWNSIFSRQKKAEACSDAVPGSVLIKRWKVKNAPCKCKKGAQLSGQSNCIAFRLNRKSQVDPDATTGRYFSIEAIKGRGCLCQNMNDLQEWDENDDDDELNATSTEEVVDDDNPLRVPCPHPNPVESDGTPFADIGDFVTIHKPGANIDGNVGRIICPKKKHISAGIKGRVCLRAKKDTKHSTESGSADDDDSTEEALGKSIGCFLPCSAPHKHGCVKDPRGAE